MVAALALLCGCALEVPSADDVVDVAEHVEPLTITFINSSGGQALDNLECKLRYVRGYTMGYSLGGGNHNEYSCTADYCQRNGTFPITRKVRATGCFDISGGLRKCTLVKVDCNPDGSGCVTFTEGWFNYPASCNPAPHPKASLFCGAGHDADCNNNIYQRRVFDAPNNTLEVF